MAARKPWAYLAKGDCLELMGAIPDGRVDMVLCDLPYGITECKWDRKIALGPLWDHYTRVVRPGGVIALFAQQPFATELAAGAPGKLLRYEWIWDKGRATGFANARRMPLRRHENILVFYKKGPTYHPQGLRPCHRTYRRRTAGSEVYDRIDGKPYVQTHTGYPQSIIKFGRERGAAPCQKPVALLESRWQGAVKRGEGLRARKATGRPCRLSGEQLRSLYALWETRARWTAMREAMASALRSDGQAGRPIPHG